MRTLLVKNCIVENIVILNDGELVDGYECIPSEVGNIGWTHTNGVLSPPAEPPLSTTEQRQRRMEEIISLLATLDFRVQRAVEDVAAATGVVLTGKSAETIAQKQALRAELLALQTA